MNNETKQLSNTLVKTIAFLSAVVISVVFILTLIVIAMVKKTDLNFVKGIQEVLDAFNNQNELNTILKLQFTIGIMFFGFLMVFLIGCLGSMVLSIKIYKTWKEEKILVIFSFLFLSFFLLAPLIIKQLKLTKNLIKKSK